MFSGVFHGVVVLGLCFFGCFVVIGLAKRPSGIIWMTRSRLLRPSFTFTGPGKEHFEETLP